jgi:hypothetical protein
MTLERCSRESMEIAGNVDVSSQIIYDFKGTLISILVVDIIVNIVKQILAIFALE